MSVSRETDTIACLTRHIAVSRETADRLSLYASVLATWQKTMNLVGPSTLPVLWTRHILDSAQVVPYLPEGPLIDMGSGAGFPGLVIALLRPAGGPVHLVESDSRKCAFLREVARVTETPVHIHNVRIESLPAFPVAALTARALAPLDRLLDWAAPFLTPRTECFFLKGLRVEDELTSATKTWKMRLDRIPSLSDPTAVILHLREVYRG